MNRHVLALAASCTLMMSAAARAEDQSLIEAGAQVYETNCSPCHGERLNNPGTSFDLKLLHPDERERFNTSVMNGKGPMPPWRGALQDEELDQLWEYIRHYAYD